jgi:transcriptional regulator with XRE-family HTH domain
MKLPPTFGERLLLARRRVALDQEELGDLVGLTGHTIGRLERGQTKQVRSDVLRRLARVLQVTTDWLVAMDVSEEEPLAGESEDLRAIPHL